MGEKSERVDSKPEIVLTDEAPDTVAPKPPNNPAAAAWVLGVGNPKLNCAVAEAENKAPGWG